MPEAALIRPSLPSDYAELCSVQTACDPEHPQTPSDLAQADSLADPRVFRNSYVWEAGGRILGYAGYLQFSLMFDPRRFVLYGGVLAEARGRGIGGALLARLMDDLAPRRPRTVGFSLWAFQEEGQRFLAARGYREILRETESCRSLASFDMKPHATAMARLSAQGLRLASLAQLGDGRALRERVFALDMAVSEDIPMTGALTRPDFGIYAHLHFEHPRFRPELCWLALDGDEPVGLTWHWAGARPGEMENCVSGVRRDYRRRGIALALKATALADGRTRGWRSARTRNAMNNTGMLAVNRLLGFEACGAMSIVEKELEA